MIFKGQSVRQWEREWRESDWRETIPLASGRECPECLATICSGRSWRAHWAKHTRDSERLETMHEQLAILSRAVRELAIASGHQDWYPDRHEVIDTQVTDGYVIGSGELPAETRGGAE